MQKKFNKGDKVTVISSWDNKGVMQIRKATVEAFGAKVCRLRCDATGEMFKRNFSAIRELEVMSRFNGAVMLPTGPDVDMEAAALRYGKEVRDENIARLGGMIERNGHAGAGYLRACRTELDELKAATPAFFWKASK